MITFECKQCGAPVEADEKQTTAVCRYCNLLQTFDPNQELHNKLMTHANKLRREMEYDRAMELYDGMLKEDPENAEVHWGKVLCRFGVAYVTDPKTGKNIPTCNRMSEISVFADPDYQDCIESASLEARMFYEEDAKKIEKLRKTYFDVIQKLTPYDVFISFKDTDGDVRTRDSALAEELYRLLTDQGYRVFFSRISLKDVVGEDYEPYIYAALQSARVMLVVGTTPRYIEAVWVKNEWSRYLRLVSMEPEKRLLIPLIREMRTDELPKELQAFEGYDLGNWRFRDSLLLKVAEFCNRKTVLTREKRSAEGGKDQRVHIITAENLFKRAEFEIEAGNMEKAGEMVERGLDLDPENSSGYWQQLVVYTNNFHKMILGDKRAEKIYERACRLAPEQKKIEYQAKWRIGQAESLWHAFEDNLDAAADTEEALENILKSAKKSLELDSNHPDRKEKMAAFEKKARSHILKKDIHKKYAASDNEYSQKVRKLENELVALREKGESLSGSVHFLPCILPAFALLLALYYGSTNAMNGPMYNFVLRVLNVFVLIALVLAAALSTKGRVRLALILASLGLGGWNFYVTPSVTHGIRMYGAIYLILLFLAAVRTVKMFSAGRCRGGFQSKQKELRKVLKKWDNEYTKALEEAKKQYPNEVFERDYGCCQSPYAEDQFCYYRTENNRSFTGNLVRNLISLVCMGTVLFAMLAADGFVVSKSLELKWKDVVLLDAGPFHVIGMKSDGTMLSAGLGDNGRCDVDKWSDKKVKDIACGFYHTAALLEDGKVISTDNQADGRTFEDIASVTAGSQVTLGLRKDGTVVGGGDNVYGQLNTEEWSNIKQVAVGGSYYDKIGFTAGLREDGTVAAVGSGVENLEAVNTWTDIVDIEAGWDFLAGLKSDGTVVMTADNGYDVSTISGVTDMSAMYISIFLKSDGTAVLAGEQEDIEKYQGDPMENLVSVVNGRGYAAGLRADGTVALIYNQEIMTMDTSGWKDIKTLVGSMYNLYGIQSDGTVLATGDNSDMGAFVGAIPVKNVLSNWLGRLPIGKI